MIQNAIVSSPVDKTLVTEMQIASIVVKTPHKTQLTSPVDKAPPKM